MCDECEEMPAAYVAYFNKPRRQALAPGPDRDDCAGGDRRAGAAEPIRSGSRDGA